MKGLLIAITFLIFGCSKEKSEDMNFPDLTSEEKIELFREFGEELKGDFIIYSGQVEEKDTTGFHGPPTFIELVMDKNNRFAIRFKFIESEVKTDSMTFSFQGGNSNKGSGIWTDLGSSFELKFKLGTVDSFFDNENNNTRIEIVDRYTLKINKTVDKLWIWQVPCEKIGE